MGSEARRRDRSASLRGALRETGTELGARRATLSSADRGGESRSKSVWNGSISRGDYRRTCTWQMNSIAAAATGPAFLPFGSFAWFKRELAPTPVRARRTAIMVAAAVLCVIISMTLQVPELSVTAYMPFFMSKESKFLTTLTGVIGLIGLTIGIGVSLLLYKFTYGHPELRIPGMAIAIFLGMWLSRVFVLGPLGFLIGFVVAVSQSVGEAVPSPELLVRGILWLWVAIAYGAGLTVVLNTLFLPNTPNESSHSPKPKDLFVSDAFTNPAHVHFALKVTLAPMSFSILHITIYYPQ